jgi:hypothetical protein
MGFVEGQRRHDLGYDAPHELLRSVEGISGEVELELELASRSATRSRPRSRPTGSLDAAAFRTMQHAHQRRSKAPSLGNRPGNTL